MSDLISRCKLFNKLATVQTLAEAYAVIQGMDTEDAVEVIRCRDCKHNPIDTWFDCPMAHLPYNANRWCWKGERKDGDHETDRR